jgi:helicase, recD/traA family
MVEKNHTLITLEGNFNRYIYESDNSNFFIASIILKPYAYKNLQEYILEEKLLPNNMTIEEVTDKNIVLRGDSENFKREIQDKVSEYSITGKLVFDEKYKRFQLELITFFEKLPTTEEAMTKFLVKKIATIGKTTAKKIIHHFGIENVEQIFNYEPNRLLEVQGIKEAQLEAIKSSWNEHQAIFEVLNYLKDYEVSDSIGLKIFNKYEKKSLEIIQTLPYKLCDIEGVSFLTADKIAQKNGIKKTDAKRIMYGIYYALSNYIYNSGNTVMHLNDLLTESVEVLGLEPELVLGYINMLMKKERIIRVPYPINVKKKKMIGVRKTENEQNKNTIQYDENYVTLNKFLSLENKIFDLIIELISTTFTRQVMTQAEIELFEQVNEYKLDEYQLKSVVSIFHNKFNILTGGPGTGKSYTVKSIIHTYEKHGLKVNLLAPTGKAAQRLFQSTGRPAETLHRFLKLLPESAIIENQSLLDSNEFLDTDLLIIDESSMLDLYVVYQCLKRLNPMRTGILYVGDINQLPPVGIGYFFRDVIESNLINVARLEFTHRMSEDSSVYQNAYNLMHGLPLRLDKTEDFEFIEENNAEKIEEIVLDIYSKLLMDGNTSLDIQVLSPVREGVLGVKSLNNLIRPIANPNFDEEMSKSSKALSFIAGDKVMQTDNNYELMVFNGDTGIVKNYDIVKDKTIIEFGDPNFRIEEKEYDKKILNQLDLAYCITIHKSQGSDYPYIILPIYNKHYYQLYTKLVYTAMTRTKKKLFIIGNKRTLLSIHDPNKNQERKTILKTLFTEMKNNNINLSDEEIFN